MKKIIITLLVASIGMSVSAQNQSLEIVVKNIKNDKGSILVGLSNVEKNFLKENFRGEKVKANGSEVTIIFKDLPVGDYAISVVHDEDENGEMDSNLFGIPKEGFGFGNDAMGMFGPPSFEKAKISFQGTKKSEIINLRYM